MNDLKEQRPLETWTAAEVQLSIEYVPHVLEEINAYATDGMKRLSRRGIGVGGVLFGTRGENAVRILTWRPIACEHANGAGFILSAGDQNGLAALLKNAKSDPELSGQQAVGWFVSHPREGVALTESDLELYNHFFPWSWHIALVLCPFRDEATRAGFFVRDAQGRVKSDASHQEFQIEGRAPRSDRGIRHAVIAEYEPESQPAAASQLSPPERPFHSLSQARIFSDRRFWIWAVPVLLALVVWAMLSEKSSTRSLSPSLGLRVSDQAGQLRLDWDRSAAPVRDAARATLSIRDEGAPAARIDIDRAHLAFGTYVYARRSTDVEVVLTVYPASGAPVAESARLIVPPGRGTRIDNPVELQRERDELVKENDRLKEDLRRETSRNHELEEAVKALQNRVATEQSERPR